jgi:hypothetical protein
MTHAAAQLDYAPDTDRHRRRRRRLVLFATVALAVIVSAKWLKPAVNHGRLLYFQHRCLTYTAPPDHVAFDISATRSRPSEWQMFYALFSPPGGRDDGTIFLHGLQRPDGAGRLVAITVGRPMLTSIRDLAIDAIDFDVHVIRPGTLWSRPRLCHEQIWRTPFVRPFAGDRQVRLFTGQCDPANLAHFTIGYECDGKRGTIDGWLQSDDTILLEPRAPGSHDQ